MREFVVPVIILGLGIAFETPLALHPQTTQSASHLLSHLSEISSYTWKTKERPLLQAVSCCGFACIQHPAVSYLAATGLLAFSSLISEKEGDTNRFSTYDQTEIPPRQLRRRSTVTTLKRWASKRVSRASLNDTQGNELSEKNLSSLEHETLYLGGNNNTITTKDLNLKEIAEGEELAKRTGSIQEVVETLPHRDLQEDRYPYILQEYDAFCHEFTLSGSHRTQKDFDLSMEIGQDANDPIIGKSKINHTLTSHLAEESGSPFSNLEYQANISQPQLMNSKWEDTAPQTQSITSMYPGGPSTNDDNSGITGKETDISISSYQPQPPLLCYDSACLYGDAARHSRAKTIPAKKPLATAQVAIFKRIAT
ncbi:hypothetical protein N7481_006249 [Penicillium waksmanii]|uniref:uncharacterized protein n=1 Tax=Penicillium waksmanii TaxID=69791 RepID=UPI002549828A|nr:uncharacterized protein N7481_006249 [Penicillium waksmanii]KAJ5984150.1 hypothetical protein N7481_006249 [Penicillium waksmanii]